MTKSRQTIAVILAAGQSTRMKTRLSKLLHPILGRSIIQWAAHQSAIITPQMIFVVGYQKEEVEASVQNIKTPAWNLNFVEQKERLGTADAVKAALSILPPTNDDHTDVFIMAGDAILLEEKSLKEFHHAHQQAKAILSVMTSFVQPPHAYGRIIRNVQDGIEKIVEAKDATPEQLTIAEMNTGFYLIQLKALRLALKEVQPRNQAQEFYLTDIVEISRKHSWLVQSYSIPVEESLGINTQQDLSLVTDIIKSRINNRWMDAGVTMVDPAHTWIDQQVEMEAGVRLNTGVCLRGTTKIMSGAEVGPYCVIEDSVLGNDVQVDAFCHLKEAKMGEESKAGPFARLRPGAILDERVHIGNFVEIKKSHLKSDVKVGHLTYLGDTDVDEKSNIGAGTITCNYDGYAKHQTKLGKNVFVGSNSSLVAPLTIGDGAIVGAGSVVTKNVSANALVMERAEQTEVVDGALRFREKRRKKPKSN